MFTKLYNGELTLPYKQQTGLAKAKLAFFSDGVGRAGLKNCLLG